MISAPNAVIPFAQTPGSSTVTLPLLPVQTSVVGADGLTFLGRVDRAARIVHADHDQFWWFGCGHDACRALRDVYNYGDPRDGG